MDLSSNNEPSYQRAPAQALCSVWISLLQSHSWGGQVTGHVHISLLSQIQLDLCLLLRLRDRRKKFLFVTKSVSNKKRSVRRSGVLNASYLLHLDIFIGIKTNQSLSAFLVHFFPK